MVNVLYRMIFASSRPMQVVQKSLLQHESTRKVHASLSSGNACAEVVTSSARDWTTGLFRPAVDALTFLCEGPRYGFRNAVGAGKEQIVAHHRDWIRFVPAGATVRSARPPGSWTYLLLFLPSALHLGQTELDFQSDNLSRLLSEIVSVTMRADEAADLSCLLEQLVDMLSSELISMRAQKHEVPASGLTDWRLKRVLRAIEDDPGQRHQLAKLAALAELKPSHFSESFRIALGITPHQYVMSRRLALARERIVDTRQSLTEIALDLGFASPSHFSNAFSLEYGRSPRELRAT
ncbi:helix-turn-helix transcriptional regulator [Neorhizobium sp. DT-125]|uniref:AraC family transcriptional regulator n=1 Tax=Neorhizobium sp. DT-125 TaxID=3396163 RepID=UPI003F1BF10A